MDVLQATLRLYREAAGEALAATRQSAIAIGLLALLFAVFTAADQVLGLADPGDSLGSQLVRGVVHAAGVGWYLALIEIPIAVRRPVRLTDLQTSLGRYWRDVLMVGFLFWMGELALRPLAGPSFPALVAIAAIIFNPTAGPARLTPYIRYGSSRTAPSTPSSLSARCLSLTITTTTAATAATITTTTSGFEMHHRHGRCGVHEECRGL